MEWAHFGDPRRANMEDRSVCRKASSNFGHTFVPDRIARDVNRVVRCIAELHDKANDRASLESRRTVAGWSCDDAQPTIRCGLQILALPRIHPKAVSTQALCAFGSSQNQFRRRQRLASCTVKIVEVVVVTEQNIVDWWQVFHLNRRWRELMQSDGSRGIVAAFWVECRIRKDSGPIQLQQHGRATDVGDTKVIHTGLMDRRETDSQVTTGSRT